MSQRIRVVLNPTAGGGAAGRLRSEVERELGGRGLDVDVRVTEGGGHALELAAAAAGEGASAVVAVGGDGTVHEVANGLLLARASVDELPPLGVIPVGSGNDFARILGCGPGRRRAYDLLARGTTRRFDVGRVTWEDRTEYFINGFGTGIDVEVVRQAQRPPRIRGLLGYLLAVLRAVAVFDPLPLRVRLDGDPAERNMMIVAVGNGISEAGGFYVWPDAVPDDGLLDVCIVDALNLLEIARVLPQVLRGRHVGLPKVNMHRVRRIEIEAAGDAPLFFQLDGELREPAAARRVVAEIEAAALPVIAEPAAAASGAAATGRA